MRPLTTTEVKIISGSISDNETFWCQSSFGSPLYGAILGGSISLPISLIGLVFVLTADKIIWSETVLFAGIFVAGVTLSALLGQVLEADFSACYIMEI